MVMKKRHVVVFKAKVALEALKRESMAAVPAARFEFRLTLIQQWDIIPELMLKA